RHITEQPVLGESGDLPVFDEYGVGVRVGPDRAGHDGVAAHRRWSGRLAAIVFLSGPMMAGAAATIVRVSSRARSPRRSVPVPPASSTISIPPAASHGPSPYSQ